MILKSERKQFFNYKPLELDSLEIITSGLENCFVNGSPNKSIADKIFPNRILKHGKQQAYPFKGKGYDTTHSECPYSK